MPLFPVSEHGAIAEVTRVTEYPVATDAVANFNAGAFSGVDTTGIWRIVVWTTGGTGVEDAAGNTYNLDVAGGLVNIWSARIDAIPADGSALTAHNATALHARLIGGVDPTSYLGPTSSGGGSFNDIQTGPSPAVYTGTSGAITLPEREDLLFGAWTTGTFRADPSSFDGVIPDPTPGTFSTDWSEQRIQSSDENSGYPGAAIDPYLAHWTGIEVSHPSSNSTCPLTGWELSVTWSYSPIIIGPYPDWPPGTNTDHSWDLLIVAYRPAGVGAIDVGEPPATANDGVDLIVSSIGLHRASRDGTSIKFQTLRWGADDWDAAFTIATDADDTIKNGAVPCLAINEHEDLYCWYHTPDPTTVGYMSEDFGQTWEGPYASHAGLRYPRIAFARERFLVSLYNISILDVFESSDGGVTLELAVTFATQPKQRPNLQVDHTGRIHLVWEDADGNVVHRGTLAPGQLGSWSDPVTLVTGHVPAYAVGHRMAVHWSFDEDDPPHFNPGLTDSTYAAPDAASDIDIPLGVVLKKAFVGLVWDVRDHLWLLTQNYFDEHDLILFKCENDKEWLLWGAGDLGP